MPPKTAEEKLAAAEAKLAEAEGKLAAAEEKSTEAGKRAAVEKRRATAAEKRAAAAEEAAEDAEREAGKLLEKAAVAEELAEPKEADEEDLVFAKLLEHNPGEGFFLRTYSKIHKGRPYTFEHGKSQPVPVSLASYLADFRNDRVKGSKRGELAFEISENDPS